MAPPPKRRPPDARPGISIGALSRATDVPVETLRTWESRYGFPRPERRPSGHRRYPLSAVQRVRRIGVALAAGLRAGDVVPLPEAELAALLSAVGAAPATEPVAPSSADSWSDVAAALARFDGAGLTRLMLRAWSSQAPLDFLEQTLAPLVARVGDAWQRGELAVRHEHFFSERVGDLLRSWRAPFEDRATGPLVLLATLPGEPHALGLQMAALVVAVGGARPSILGATTPVADIAHAAREQRVAAVGVSVSAATRGAASRRQLQRLRRELPRPVALLVGGAGVEPQPGITVVADLSALERWLRGRVPVAGTR